MKRILFLGMMTLLAVSCSKKVKVNGFIKNSSPLERIEFIDASGVATLPLVNIGIDDKGHFSGEFEAPNDGMYAMTYGGQMSFVYLKKGQELKISGDEATFPNVFTVEGDAKKNNDYIKGTQEALDQYLTKLEMSMMSKDEKSFLADIQKTHADLTATYDKVKDKVKPDSDVVEFKNDELKTNMLTLLEQYEENHGEATQNPNFKVSQAFKDYVKTLEVDNDRMVKKLPIYRNYLLNKLGEDFQKFALAQSDKSTSSMSAIFAKYLKSKTEFSQVTKDYLLAFVISKFDLNPFTENSQDIIKVADENIKDSAVKKDLNAAFDAVYGLKQGSEVPASKLMKADGSAVSFNELKGRPTLVMTYASWNPYVKESTIPVLKEVVDFYKSKMNFVFVNVDDTKEQFLKSYKAILKDIPGENLYADKGLESQYAKDFKIYGFKIPGFILLDKDGKVQGPTYYNLGEPKFIDLMNKLTGLKAPTEHQIEVSPDWNKEQAAAPADQVK